MNLKVTENPIPVGLTVTNDVSPRLTMEQVQVIRESAQDIVFVDTTDNWDRQTTLVPKRGQIIIYLDRDRIADDVGNVIYVPGIKIGDGTAYVVDLPFIDDAQAIYLAEHINDRTLHITQQEREFWNNKLNYDLNGETLMLNRQ